MNLKIFFCIAVLVGFSAISTAADAPRITKEGLKSIIGDPGLIILDARADTEWAASSKKIKGAVRVDPSDVKSWADSLPKDKKIVIYCS